MFNQKPILCVALFVCGIYAAWAIKSPFLDLLEAADTKCLNAYNIKEENITIADMLNGNNHNTKDDNANIACYVQCLLSELGIINESGWHKIIVDDLLKIARAENYVTEFQRDLEDDGKAYAQLAAVCTLPIPERTLSVGSWFEQILKSINERLIRFLTAKPQYFQYYVNIQRKMQCLSEPF